MTSLTPSPLAPARFVDLASVPGLHLATAASGLKYKGRDDLLLIVADEGTSFAGVFTQSATAAAPVLVSKAGLATGQARAILTNAGNANAFTGRAGDEAIADYRDVFAGHLGLAADQILIASTGVIGEPLDGQAVAKHAEQMTAALGSASWQDAALAIRTTDTFAKGASRTVEIDGQTVTLNGIAKGSGMIAPDMATMLAYIATDACIAPACLQKMLEAAVQTSFTRSRLTVTRQPQTACI